ncbi:MAG: serine protease MucD, partial [Nitrospirae bacterium]|nr:serine protease MucD [Nitrospirota bacterium]
KGVMVQGITPEMRNNLDIPKRITGVVVTDIEDGSPAEGVLMANDVIAEVNRKKITGMKYYEAVVSQIKADQDILLLVFRNGSAIYITLTSK